MPGGKVTDVRRYPPSKGEIKAFIDAQIPMMIRDANIAADNIEAFIHEAMGLARYGCRHKSGDTPPPEGGPSYNLHHNASPSHEEGAWCNDCSQFAPLSSFDGGYDQRYLKDSGERQKAPRQPLADKGDG